MVQTLLETLPVVAPDIEVHHVNLPLSRDSSDIGSWRLGKLSVVWRAIRQVRTLIRRHGPMTLYYVPAPGKRSALYRDILLMMGCRGCCERLVLHWHASGLGGWLQRQARPWERALAHRALGRADLSLVLGEALKDDAAMLHPLRTAVIRNGIADPCPHPQSRPARQGPLNVAFISQCSRSKGVLRAVAGVAEAHRRCPGSVRLTVAGDFEDEATERAFCAAVQASGAPIDHIGFVTNEAKHHLFAYADALLFPTSYEHETQGLVVAEALAYDLPVVVSRWRAVHENLPSEHSHVVPANGESATAIADALETIARAPRPDGSCRMYFLDHYTDERFAKAVERALRA
jgi:glycosyltransferase involved in cell wall biosynthesis